MIRVAIVEDEENYISVLKDYLEQYKRETGEQIEVTVYHDGDEIAAFYRAQFDVILMDIEMKFIDGMTAAGEIRKVCLHHIYYKRAAVCDPRLRSRSPGLYTQAGVVLHVQSEVRAGCRQIKETEQQEAGHGAGQRRCYAHGTV